MTVLSRAQVLGYRASVHHLEGPVAEDVLLAGVRDYPPGRTAGVALRVRGLAVDPDRLVLVHSVRAAPHVHLATDVGRFAAVLRTLEVADLAKEHFGPFGRELDSLGGAVSHVAEAMRQVFADGQPRTKAELSTALNGLVDARLRPWCQRCAVDHVHDVLFRYATLQAGLAIIDNRYLPSLDLEPLPDPAESQSVLVRRFLRLCGPCQPEHLARWLALSSTAARRLRGLLDDQLVAVTVDGRPGWVHREDLDELRNASSASSVRLLPPYDPLTELADRELLLPDRTQRNAVWRPVGNPGVLLVRGEIAGTFRQRTTARRLTVTIQPFGTLTAADRRAASRQVESSGTPAEAVFAS